MQTSSMFTSTPNVHCPNDLSCMLLGIHRCAYLPVPNYFEYNSDDKEKWAIAFEKTACI